MVFLKLKKHAVKSMKTNHTNILPKNEFENGQYYCTSLKYKIVYDGIVPY